MKNVVFLIVFFSLLMATSSCGKKAKNVKMDLLNSNQEFNFLILERQCLNGQSRSLPIVKEIINYYKDFKAKYPLTALNIPSREYSHKRPLAVSAYSISEEFNRIKNKYEDAKNRDWLLVTQIGEELHYLVQASERFDGLKCSLPNMVQNKNQDLRPSLFFSSLCPNGVCTEEIFDHLTSSNKEKIYKEAIKLCGSFNNELICEAELEMRKRSRRVAEFINQFQTKFKDERFDKLFTLRKSHLNFNCFKHEEKTVMNIKVLETGWERSELEELLNDVALAWSNQSFELKFELVLQPGNNIVEIRRVASTISHVPDNDNRIVYLSKAMDLKSQKLILKHEFGHVLGFPDCYIEYYDEKEQKLIYYELSEKNSNIMCTMSEHVKVPEAYFKELKEKSCLFE